MNIKNEMIINTIKTWVENDYFMIPRDCVVKDVKALLEIIEEMENELQKRYYGHEDDFHSSPFARYNE